MTKIETTNLSRTKRIGITLSDGSYVELLTRGATLTRWKTPDGHDIVAGYRDYSLYGKGGMYLGGTIGMNAGRIQDGRCTIAGVPYELKSSKKHYLHNGGKGLDKVEFDVVAANVSNGVAKIALRTAFAHPVIPSLATVDITYEIGVAKIALSFVVTTDRPTLCNLTNHSYFNLAGDYDHPVADHTLRLAADRIVLVDDEIIATDILPVAGTIYDFRIAKALLPTVLDPVLQNQGARGIDHYFLFDETVGPQVVLTSKRTGKRLEITTTYPGTTLYTTNYPTPDAIQTGRPLARHAAVAVEPQFQANGVNDRRFHDFTLLPGETYRHKISYELKEEPR